MRSLSEIRSCAIIFSEAYAVAEVYRDHRLPLWWTPKSISMSEMSGHYDQLAHSLGNVERHLSCVAVLRTAVENVSIVYENGKLGTDFSNIAQVSTHLGCAAVSVSDNGISHRELETGAYQRAASWEHIDQNRGVRRAVSVNSQDGRWYFEAHGEPLEYENVSIYQARNKKERMNGVIIANYLEKLRAPVIDSCLMPRSESLKWIRVRAG